VLVTLSKILQHPGVRFISVECEGEIPAVARGNGIIKPKTRTRSMLPKYLAVAIQAGIENHTGRSKFLNVDTLSIDGPAAKAVGGNQALEGDLFNQCSCQVTWTYSGVTGN
jgi:hypothetical protein